MAVTPEQLEREILTQKPFFPSNTAIYMTGSNPSRNCGATAAAGCRVLEDIDDVLRSCTDNELEMMVSRHLKHSL